MKVSGLLLVIGLAGCAAQGSSKPQESEATQRAEIHTTLAAGYVDRGQFGVALQEAKEALQARSDFGPAYNVQGLVYMELGEYAQAEENFHKAVSLNPADSDARNNFGRFLCDRGRFAEGEQQFAVVLKDSLYRSTDRTLLNAARCAMKAGDPARAIVYFERAFKVNPNMIPARVALADVAYRAGRLSVARQYLAGIADSPDATADALWLALRTERRLGDRDMEGRLGRELRKRFPDAVETRLLLAGQYE